MSDRLLRPPSADLISFRSLRDLRHAPARFRHDTVSIGLRLIDLALKIGARGLHVAESVDHLRRRVAIKF